MEKNVIETLNVYSNNKFGQIRIVWYTARLHIEIYTLNILYLMKQ